MSKFKKIAFLFVIIGALNWGLVGLFGLDLVKVIFGDMSIFSRIVYIVVGISGIVVIMDIKKFCKVLKK